LDLKDSLASSVLGEGVRSDKWTTAVPRRRGKVDFEELDEGIFSQKVDVN
jgi:hypothetical protein